MRGVPTEGTTIRGGTIDITTIGATTGAMTGVKASEVRGWAICITANINTLPSTMTASMVDHIMATAIMRIARIDTARVGVTNSTLPLKTRQVT